MRTIIFIVSFIITITSSAQGDTSLLRHSFVSIEIDESNYDDIAKELTPGSEWELLLEDPFVLTCDAQSEFIYSGGTIQENIIQYLPRTESDCSAANYLPDANNQMVWSNLGLVQDAVFGIDSLTCNIEFPDCNLNQTFFEERRVAYSIEPTIGEQGTQAGRLDVFAYDVQNTISSHIPGLGGIGGENNLPLKLEIPKYCYTIKDASTDGADSNIGKTPVIQMKKIIWVPIEGGQKKRDGATPEDIGRGTTVIKGLDDSMREFVRQDIESQQ